MKTNFKGTQGIFSDGHTGWKVEERTTNGIPGFEIHYSDDGECVTDHVYHIEDAKLIANAPEILYALENILRWSAHFPALMNGELHFAQRVIEKTLK
jgi:hypothetical protein